MTRMVGRFMWGLIGMGIGLAMVRTLDAKRTNMRPRGWNRRTRGVQRALRVASRAGGETLARTLRAMRS